MAGERRLPVMLVPGVITPADISYRDLLPQLGDDIEIVLKDLEIYSTDAPPANYELGMEADGIKRAADAAGFDAFHLVGYSGGGASSLVFTARYPSRVSSLALIEPAWIGNDGWTPEETAYWREIDRVRTLPPAERIEGFARLNAGSGRFPLSSGPQPEWMSKRPAGIEALTQAFTRYDLDSDLLRRYRGPVYVAAGGLSHPSEQRKAERLLAIFPDIRAETYEDRHHMDPPHRAEAGRFARALRELWNRAERQQSSVG